MAEEVDVSTLPEELQNRLRQIDAPLSAGQLTTGQRLVRQAALPTMLGALGAAAGVPAAPVTLGIANPVTLGMLGSMTGEALNQWGPIQQFTQSPENRAMIPLAGAGTLVGPTLRFGAKMLPGITQGLQDFAEQQVGRQGEVLRSAYGATRDAVRDAFAKTKGLQPLPVALARTSQESARLVNEAATSDFASAGFKTLAKRGETFSGRGATPPSTIGSVPFDVFRTNLSNLGASVSRLSKTGGQAYGAAKDLYKAMVQDLDDALQAAPATLRSSYAKAIETTKREQVSIFLDRAFKQALRVPIDVAQTDYSSLYKGLVQKREVLDRLIPRKEVSEILDLVQELTRIPVSSKVSGEGLRSIIAPERIMMGTAIGAAAAGLGHELPGAVGIGAAGILGVEVISKALSSPIGRKIISSLADKGLPADQIANALFQAGRAGTVGQE